MKPVVRDEFSAVFFEGAKEGKLLVRRCPRTGDHLDLRSDDSSVWWVTASGLGTVVSWAVVHGKDAEGQPTRVTVGIVELDEGPWWWCQLADVDPDSDLMGLRVATEFVSSGPAPEHEPIPVFMPFPAMGDR